MNLQNIMLVTKNQRSYDPVYMKCPEKENL